MSDATLHPVGATTTSSAPAADDRPARSLRRRLRAPLLTSLVVQIVLVLGDRMPSVDAMSYFETGRNWVDGKGYTRQGSPELHFPPVAPLGFGILEKLLGSDIFALRAWNLLWGLAAVLLLTAIGWYLSCDDDVVVATAWFATLVPGVITLSIKGASGSELPAACFLLASALVVLWALDRGRGPLGLRRYGAVAGAGALTGLAYLTRPESLMPGGAIGLFVLILAWRSSDHGPKLAARRALAAGAAFGVTTALLMAPYLAYMHGNTGSWSLTSKTKDASIDAWRAVAEDNRLERDQILYAIQPDGVSLGPDTVPLTQLAREHPRGWLTIAWTNTTTMAEMYLGTPWRYGPVWQLVPLFLLIPALERIWTTRRRTPTQLFAAVGAFPLVTCFLFFALPRYLILTSAVLIPFGTWGLVVWLRRLPARPRRLVWRLVAALTLLSFVVGAWTLLPGSPDAERTEQRTAGLWLAENTDPNARVMTRSFHVQDYSQRPTVAWPYADWPTTLEFARRMGVTYIVADDTTVRRRRPELYDLLVRSDEVPEGVVLVHEFTERGKVVKIYQLDPAAPPTDQPPLPLGYVSD